MFRDDEYSKAARAQLLLDYVAKKVRELVPQEEAKKEPEKRA